MGFFDTVKAKAGELAADAGRAGKVATAQTRLVSLQNDVRKAERNLGQAAFALIEEGELEHPALDEAAGALLEAHEALQAKELEIAVLRAEAGQPEEAGGSTVTYVASNAPTTTAETARAPVGEAADTPHEPGPPPPPAAPDHPVPGAPSAAAAPPSPLPPEHPEVHAGHTPAEEIR